MTQKNDLGAAARRYRACGLCVLPARADRKCPAVGRWGPYQKQLPTVQEVTAWFDGPQSGLCLVCGAVSGNLEMLDFDLGGEAFQAWYELVQSRNAQLLARLVIEQSPSGGWHVVYRCQGPVSGNLKLAERRQITSGPDAVTIAGKTYKPRCDADGRWYVLLTLIETRGEGGLFLCAPTPGYEVLQGDLAELPTLTVAERETLLEAAWSLGEHAETEASAANGQMRETREKCSSSDPSLAADRAPDSRPGDDFNERGDLRAVLRRHGWTLAKAGENEYWRRPGKTAGSSATLKDGVFYVFSSSAAPFEPNQAYSPFAVYALLEHGGDYAAAASALRAQGFGSAADTTDGEALEAIDWQPYPVEALPEAIRRYVKEEAAALGCEAAMVALPLVAALGAAIGTTRRVIVKPGWRPYPILWAAIVAESGQLKTPAIRAATQWTRQRDDEAAVAAAAAQQAYEVREVQYARKMAAWKRKGEGEPPVKPAPVVVPRYCVADVTIEALAPILRDNPRGVLLCRDELSGWFGAFDRYTGTKGGDVATWLSAYNAESLRIDRKTSGTIHVARAAVAVVGGIQPQVLSRALGEMHRENGLAARFLFVAPPPRPKRFTEEAASAEAIEAVAAVFSRLFGLEHDADYPGDRYPLDVGLSPEAKVAFAEFYNRHGAELATLTGDLAAAFSKLEELPARLALILHHVRLAAGESVDPTVIDADTMHSAIVLTEWHKRETRRVYALLDSGPAGRAQERLVRWIRSRGGATTAREVQRGCRWLREPGDAEAALEELVQAGLGTWESTPNTIQGGRPTRRFRLAAKRPQT